MYTLKQVTNILAKAAERADYQHIGFTRSPIEVSIQFHEAYLSDKPELKPFTSRTLAFHEVVAMSITVIHTNLLRSMKKHSSTGLITISTMFVEYILKWLMQIKGGIVDEYCTNFVANYTHHTD